MANQDDWASDDDANDLLAGILSETEDEAAAEQERIAAEVKAKEEQKRREQEEEKNRRKAEAEARITAEMDRLDQLEKRRAERAEALRIEELKAKGEWEEPEAEVSEPQELTAQQKQAAINAQQARQAAQHQATPEQQAAAQSRQPQTVESADDSGGGMGIILTVVAVLVLGVAGGGYAWTQGRYTVDNTSYSKAVYQPKKEDVQLVTMGFKPVPKPTKDKAEEDKEPSTHHRRRHRPRRHHSTKKTKKKKKKGLKLDLGGDTDPFGSDF